jgi:hypothetical protein
MTTTDTEHRTHARMRASAVESADNRAAPSRRKRAC